LLEVTIVSEGLGDSAFLHDEEAGAVGQAPALVFTLEIELDRRTELLVGLGNDLNTWLLVEVTDQLSDFVPRLWAVPGDVIQGLGQGHLRRQHFVIATKRGPSEGLVV